MAGIVYDTGALTAAERHDKNVLALHQQTLAAQRKPVVPVVVLAQAWRGGPQAQLSRVLRGCDVWPDDERIGRAAGAACAVAGTADVVDAIVVLTALHRRAVVVTSDPGDLARIADALGTKLFLQPI